jgi:hypothetical protein
MILEIKHLKYKTDEELISSLPNGHKNKPANDEDLVKMEHWLNVLMQVIEINYVDFREFHEEKIKEKNMGINIPKALRLLYSYVGSNEKVFSSGTNENELEKISKQKLLKYDELTVEKNILIYDTYGGGKADYENPIYETDILIYGVTQKNKKCLAIDLRKEWVLYFHKNKWFFQKDACPVYQDVVVRLVNMIISNQKNVFKTRLKGIWNLEQMGEVFAGCLEQLNGFKYYDHTIFYNMQYHALGWYRGGVVRDLLFGCNDKIFTKEIIEKYAFDKAKILK